MQADKKAGAEQQRGGTGIHLLAEWYGCDFSTDDLNDALTLRKVCLDLTNECGLRSVGDAFYQFSPQGVTGTVLLAESHLAIHTWPEETFVTLDVFVCNYLVNNSAKAMKLYDALKSRFQPEWENFSNRPGDRRSE